MAMRIGLPMKIAQIIDHFDQDKYMSIVGRILSRAGVAVEGRPLWIAPDVFWDCAYPGAITVGCSDNSMSNSPYPINDFQSNPRMGDRAGA